jgi:hypothetical protein
MSGLTCHTAPVRARTRGIRVERVRLEAQTYRRRVRGCARECRRRGCAVVISRAKILTVNILFRANDIGRGVR